MSLGTPGGVEVGVVEDGRGLYGGGFAGRGRSTPEETWLHGEDFDWFGFEEYGGGGGKTVLMFLGVDVCK